MPDLLIDYDHPLTLPDGLPTPPYLIVAAGDEVDLIGFDTYEELLTWCAENMDDPKYDHGVTMRLDHNRTYVVMQPS